MVIDFSVIEQFEEGKPFFPQHLPVFANSPSRNVVLLELLVDYLKKRDDDGPVRILEIGARAGASALAWVEGINTHNHGLGEVLCVDMWFKLGPQDDVFFSIFRHNIKATDSQDLVVPIIGDSQKVLPSLPHEHFDLIYIDGAHCYSICTTDMANAKRLIKPGGIICGDDLEVQYKDCDTALLDKLKEQDAAMEPSPWHPGVTKAVYENFSTVKPYLGVWAVQKAEEDRFDVIDVEQVPITAVPAYFPDWAVNVAKRDLGLDTSPSVLVEHHVEFIAGATPAPALKAGSGDELAGVDFTSAATHTAPISLGEIAALQTDATAWAIASVNGDPELYLSRDARCGLTISVLNPKGTTDIGIQIPIDDIDAWRGKEIELHACLRTDGAAQLNLYDGVLGFGDNDVPADTTWQTVSWRTFLPQDATCFFPQIRLHGTRGAIAPGTQISIAWLKIDTTQCDASVAQVADMHLQRALHYLVGGAFDKAGSAMADAVAHCVDVESLAASIQANGFVDPLFRSQALELLNEHTAISA